MEGTGTASVVQVLAEIEGFSGFARLHGMTDTPFLHLTDKAYS